MVFYNQLKSFGNSVVKMLAYRNLLVASDPEGLLQLLEVMLCVLKFERKGLLFSGPGGSHLP